jgi:sugar phosphate isomerase/epimerase
MKEREDIVAAVVSAAGGPLIGRVRLQKTVYLLDQLGLSSGFGYEYHNYGPYSRDLDNATADAKAFGLVKEKFDHRQSDGAMYSIFELAGRVPSSNELYGDLDRQRVAELVKLFARTNVTVLELAATVDWLWRAERYADWRREVTKRKGAKVRGGRLDRAVELLRDIGLTAPAPLAA